MKLPQKVSPEMAWFQVWGWWCGIYIADEDGNYLGACKHKTWLGAWLHSFTK